MKVENELIALRHALVELHKLLLLSLKKDHEKISGRPMNPAEWFQVLLHAPEYQWIKPLNSLVSDTDALTELTKVTDVDLTILQHELERFFFKEDDDVTSFNSHYRKSFKNNHDIMFAHGHLRQAFAYLPKGAPPSNADEIRLGWHKIGASKRKLLN